MSEFAYVIRGDSTPSGNPQELQKTVQKWDAWMKDLRTKGLLKDPGHPLDRTGKVVKGRSKSVAEGPYSQAQDLVGGFMSIEAKDLAQAVEISKGCPVLESGGSVEVRPIMKLES